MSFQCATSARLALPTTLRSIFLSEFRHDLPPGRRLTLTPTPRHQHARPLSSTNRFLQLQVDQLQDVATKSTSYSIKPSSEKEPGCAVPDTPSQETMSATPTKPAKKPNDKSTRKEKKDRKDLNKEKKADRTAKVPRPKKKPEHWQVQKEALQKKFPAGWNPPKKLSPDALDGIRHLHASDPERFTTAVLAEEFKVSAEAIRRILKSRWKPSEPEMESRRQRWERRHERIWSQMIELGLRPPTERSRPLMDSKTLYPQDKK